MHPPSRARRILKWTGVGLSMSIVILWTASLFVVAVIVLPGNRVAVGIECGALEAGFSSFDVRTYYSLTTGIRAHSWRGFGFSSLFVDVNRQVGPSAFVSNVVLPFWLLLLLSAIPTAWLWHRDRQRIRPGLCTRCGYDLTGNTSGVCSECGEKLAVVKLS